jgi:hypothetical protein
MHKQGSRSKTSCIPDIPLHISVCLTATANIVASDMPAEDGVIWLRSMKNICGSAKNSNFDRRACDVVGTLGMEAKNHVGHGGKRIAFAFFLLQQSAKDLDAKRPVSDSPRKKERSMQMITRKFECTCIN